MKACIVSSVECFYQFFCKTCQHKMNGDTPYETARRANIERNNLEMERLKLQRLKKSTPRMPKKKAKAKVKSTTPSKPTRRSKRTRDIKPDYTGERIEEEELPPIVSREESASRRAKRQKLSTEQLIAKQREWLLEHRTKLQSQYRDDAINLDGNTWAKIAVKKWGSLVTMCGGDDNGNVDWQQYVLSRTSTPSTEKKYGLLQEEYCQCPWRLLISCVLMSRVSSASVKTHAIDGFFAKYPTPTDVMQSDPAHAFEILKPLGLFENRWKGVIEISTAFLNMHIFNCGLDKSIKIYGVGEFGVDSFEIFVRGAARRIYPSDKNLAGYCRWVRENDP